MSLPTALYPSRLYSNPRGERHSTQSRHHALCVDVHAIAVGRFRQVGHAHHFAGEGEEPKTKKAPTEAGAKISLPHLENPSNPANLFAR